MQKLFAAVDDQAVAALQARGERLTPQRLLVLEALRAGSGHLTAEQVLERVRARYPYFNQATIYRALAWSKEQGLVSETDLGCGSAEYEYLAASRHHHLVCAACGGRQEFPDALVAPLVAALRESYGFAARVDHLALFGICRHCREAASTSATQDPVPQRIADPNRTG